MISMVSPRWVHLGILVAGLGLTWYILSLGLPGGFLFDDYPNLVILDDFEKDGVVHTLKNLFQAVGVSSGRALSYLALYVDYSGWPQAAEVFRQTNILLHVVNALLVFLLVNRMCQMLNIGRGAWVASLASMLWALHPLQVSTVLYVVQRMAMLSAFFLLGALCLFVASIQARQHVVVRLGLLGGSAVLALLAVFSKESGALYVAYGLLLVCFTSGDILGRRWRTAYLSLCTLGCLVVLTYLVLHLQNLLDVYQARGFGLRDRLLMESEILMTYLGKILVPGFLEFGLYFDAYDVAARQGQAIWRLPFMAAWLVLLALLPRLLRFDSLLVFALLWFLIGHVLESTVLPLELAYDHRNYFAMIGLAIWVANGLVNGVPGWLAARLEARKIGSGKMVQAATGVATVGLALSVLLVLASTTASEATLWRSNEELMLSEFQRKPGSVRAKLSLAELEFGHGNLPTTIHILNQAHQLEPGNLTVAIRLALVACGDPAVPHILESLVESAGSAPYYNGAIMGARELTTRIHLQLCPRELLQPLTKLALQLDGNPSYGLDAGRKSDLDRLLSALEEKPPNLP